MSKVEGDPDPVAVVSMLRGCCGKEVLNDRKGPGFQGSRVTGPHSLKGLSIHVGVADRSCSMISKVAGFQGSRVKRSHRLQGIEVSPC